VSPKLRAAFTLVETVVVLGLLGLILAVVAPAVVWTPNVGGAAQPVLRLLADAQRSAVQEARLVEVTIDPASRRVWLRHDALTAVSETTFVLSLPDSLKLTARIARVRFRFRPDGTAFGDALTLHSSRESFAIVVEQSSGAPRVNAAPEGPR
jgi:type II secretory pathway pseudopilin PulG